MTAPGGDATPPELLSEAPGTPARPAKRTKLRKEEIIAAATRLFAERGYEGTSMGDLAERVGLRKASLFHHFESKDLLYGAVLSQLLLGVKEAIAAANGATHSYSERLDALSDAITGMLANQPHAARLLIREAMGAGTPAFGGIDQEPRSSGPPGLVGTEPEPRSGRPVMREELTDAIGGVLTVAVEFARGGQREGVFDSSLDPQQLVVSLIGIYFLPFVIDRTVERFTGKCPFESPFVEERRAAVKAQIRRLVLVS